MQCTALYALYGNITDMDGPLVRFPLLLWEHFSARMNIRKQQRRIFP